LSAVLVGLRRVGRMSMPQRSRRMIDLNVYVCIPFGEKMVGAVVIPGWRSLTLADPGLNHVSPSGNFPLRTVMPERSGHWSGGIAA